MGVAKADKKELDAYAVESGGRDRLSAQRIESLETDLASRVREQVHITQERWSHLEVRVEENVKQFQHWEQMWERLAGYVEDLVVKIQELQGTAAAEAARVSNMRPGSRSRETTPSRVP